MNQISVFLENKPGSLADMADALAKRSVNMKAISLSEAEGFGIVRFMVDDVYKATSVLKDEGIVHNLVQVVVASIPNEPGGLLKLLSYFKEADINIDYMYAYTGEISENARMVLKVSDYQKAEAVLRARGMEVQ